VPLSNTEGRLKASEGTVLGMSLGKSLGTSLGMSLVSSSADHEGLRDGVEEASVTGLCVGSDGSGLLVGGTDGGRESAFPEKLGIFVGSREGIAGLLSLGDEVGRTVGSLVELEGISKVGTKVGSGSLSLLGLGGEDGPVFGAGEGSISNRLTLAFRTFDPRPDISEACRLCSNADWPSEIIAFWISATAPVGTGFWSSSRVKMAAHFNGMDSRKTLSSSRRRTTVSNCE